MLINYPVGNFAPNTVYSVVNYMDNGFVAQGSGGAGPVGPGPGVYHRKRGAPGQVAKGSGPIGGQVIYDGVN